MTSKAVMSVFFGGVFGLAFIVVGIRRMWQVRAGKPLIDSMFWGAIGILIGFAFMYGVYWLMTPPPNDHGSMPFDIHSHP